MEKIIFKPIIFMLALFLALTQGAVAGAGVPDRIISLAPSLTEAVYLLQADDKLVGNTTYCLRPPDAQQKEKVGTAIAVNIEKVISLKPDLILATPLTRPDEKKKLENLGVNIVSFTYPRNFGEICTQFLKLGQLLGKEELSRDIVQQTEKEVEEIRTKSLKAPKPRVFVQIGAKPLVTVTQDSFINDYIEFAGGVNVTRDIKNTRYSRERVLTDNPDVIIIVTMGINGPEEKQVWEKYTALRAVQTGQIHIMESELFCSPTPETFVETLRKVSKILHSEYE